MGKTAVRERTTLPDAGEAHAYSNVFEALDLPDPDLLQAKATLSIAFEQRYKSLGLTQAQAGERVGLTQADVSNIVRGNLDRFSLERLTRCLNGLGIDVEVVVHPPRDQPGVIRSTWLR